MHRARCLHSLTGEKAAWTSCGGSGESRGNGEGDDDSGDDDDDDKDNDNHDDFFLILSFSPTITFSPTIVILHYLLQLFKWYLGAESASSPPSILPPLTPPVSKRLGDPIEWAWDSRERGSEVMGLRMS